MSKNRTLIVTLAVALAAACGTPVAEERAPVPPTLDEIVAIERAALDRWIRLDPQGYLDLFAPEMTYFDPQREKRIDGVEAMKTMLAPIKDLKLPFTNPRYDMIGPHLQTHGDVALLTFNLVSYGTFPGKGEIVVARWNSTEVYSRLEGKWRIIHSHWSYTQTRAEGGAVEAASERQSPNSGSPIHVNSTRPSTVFDARNDARPIFDILNIENPAKLGSAGPLAS